MKQSLFILMVFWATFAAAEDQNTIAIRRTLDNELTGWRRGDVNLITSQYTPYFTGYDGQVQVDPRKWAFLWSGGTVRKTGLEEFTAYVEKRLTGRRYDTARSIKHIEVRGDRAAVVTEETGTVTHQGTGERMAIKQYNYWVLNKIDDKWKITTLVVNVGPPAP